MSSHRSAVALFTLTGLAISAALSSSCGDDPATDSADRSAGTATGLRFEERAQAAGITFRMQFLPDEQGENFKINLYDHGCGVVIADVDGDGFDDVYFLNQLGTNALYRNRGDGTFEDVTASSPALALGDRICVAGVFGDIDDDGDQDLYVTSTRGGNVLFRNDGELRFTDITEAAGLVHVGHSQGATFFDADSDGDLDLFVTNTAEWTLGFDEKQNYFTGKESLEDLVVSEPEYNKLYANSGDGTFTDVTAAAGVAGLSWGGDVAVFDYDDDNDQDLFVTNMFGRSQLFRNDGQLKFADVTDEVFPKTSWGAIGSRAFDYDGDGRLDLGIADMHSDMWMPAETARGLIEPARKYSGVSGAMQKSSADGDQVEKQFQQQFQVDYSKVLFGNTLFRNLGGGRYEETSDKAGFETFWPWGLATADFDNDGFEDAFMPSGMGFPFFYWPLAELLHNTGKGSFVNATASAGIERMGEERFLPTGFLGRKAPRSTRCAAVADFDHDGRVDLMVSPFNDHAYYFRNASTQKPWIGFRLTGTVSNRDAVGALVYVTSGGRTQVRQVQAAGGYLSQESKTLHFGLGAGSAIERVEIVWPNGGVQSFEGAKMGVVNELSEPNDLPQRGR